MNQNVIEEGKNQPESVVTVLTPEQAAEALHVPVRTVYDLLRRGQLRGRKVGRHWRTTKEWIDEYMMEGKGD
jgi:excisionase family DNA binding protein